MEALTREKECQDQLITSALSSSPQKNATTTNNTTTTQNEKYWSSFKSDKGVISQVQLDSIFIHVFNNTCVAYYMLGHGLSTL